MQHIECHSCPRGGSSRRSGMLVVAGGVLLNEILSCAFADPVKEGAEMVVQR